MLACVSHNELLVRMVLLKLAFICISNTMSCAGNNSKLLLNDQNEFGVLDMIEWTFVSTKSFQFFLTFTISKLLYVSF